jgi:hypothetical protein
MTYTKIMVVNFGESRSGLQTVGYTLTGGTRTTRGISEVAPGTGIYQASVTFESDFTGTILWDTGESPTPRYAAEDINFGSSLPTTTPPPDVEPRFSRSLISRYGIIPNDLRIHATLLNIGQGQADRFGSSMRFIIESEIEIEEQVSEFIAVPLKPTPSRTGLTTPLVPNQPFPNTPPDFPPENTIRSEYAPEVSITPLGSKWNFPVEFIQAIIFKAIAHMLRSEFFEVEPNFSKAAVDSDQRSESYVYLFRTRPTVLVGSGRRRNSNPHMPPNIAPRGNININTHTTGM